MRVAVDIGGTFTDVVVFDEVKASLALAKTLSTPADLARGVRDGLTKAAIPLDKILSLIHGSTVVVNAIVERNGAKTALVTTKGQVTIPKELREKFGIEPGSQVDFVAGSDGIRLRKVVDRTKPLAVLGCLKKELAGRSVKELLDDLRGPVELPPARRKEKPA